MANVSQNKSAPSNADTIRGLVRFLRAVRYHKLYVLAALAVAVLLGALYYTTATPIFRATASLMVLHTGGEVWDPSLARSSAPQDLIPTFEKLFFKSVVVEGAIQRIHKLPEEHRTDFAPFASDEWPRVLIENLTASGVRGTKLIELGYCSKEPRAAEAVLGAVVDSYLEFMEQTHRDESVEIVKILDTERKQVARDLVEKQQRFRELSHRVESLGLSDHETIVHPVVQRVLELNNTLMKVRKDRLKLQSSLAAIQAARRNGRDLRPHLMSLEPIIGREMVMSAMGLDSEFREAANSSEKGLIKDRARLNTLLDHYGKRHPDVIQLGQEIEHAERFLAQHRSDRVRQLPLVNDAKLGEMLVSLVSERLAVAAEFENELESQYTKVSKEASKFADERIELSLIDHDVRLLRTLHDTLVNRIADLGLIQNKSDVRLELVSSPAALDEPVSPRLAIIAVCCLLGGLGAGTMSVYVADLLDDRFRSPEDIKEQLQLPVLGMIRELPPTTASGIDSIHVHVAPTSVGSEAFHTLRATLAIAFEDCQRLAVTSSEPNDGKTTVLANLGASLSNAGKRVLLIDADIRRGGLGKLFGTNSHEGLSHLLQSDDQIANCSQSVIVPTGIDNLDILPRGARPADPAELLSRPRLSDLVGWAETVYDFVLIDCPPVFVASDAAIVGRVAETMLLVVQPHKNHRRMVLRAADNLLGMRINIAGVVLNQIGAENDTGYYGYGSYSDNYGYGHSYAYEAEDDDTGHENLDVPEKWADDSPQAA